MNKEQGPVRPIEDRERLGPLYPGWRTYPGPIDIDLVIAQCRYEGASASQDLADALKEQARQDEGAA